MHALDNPLWASLTTLHAPLALGAGDIRRYPAEVAPFLASHRAGAVLDEQLVAPGETVFLVGPQPAVPAGWQLEPLGEILQMVCDAPPAVPDGPPVTALDDRSAAVRDLAARVYPHYFRARTTELGHYLGIFEGGALAAMSGERMGMPGFREITAVCTDPAHLGRGLARRVLCALTTEIADRGATPFLHVSPGNTRAVELYARNGYRTRIGIAFAALRRP
jgi:ribosomal protein S18 acetylase RimI-like enzyme